MLKHILSVLFGKVVIGDDILVQGVPVRLSIMVTLVGLH